MDPQSKVSPAGPSPGETAFDPGVIMQRVRAEVARRRTAAVGPDALCVSPDASVGSGASTSDVHWQPFAPRLQNKDQYALSDFLGFDDEDFVDVVYRKVLRRPANDAGSRDYVSALRGGAIGKVEILGMIRFSEEGRRHAVHVDGLLLPYRLHQWRRVPIVGWFIGMGMAVARLPRLAWRLQAIEASAARESHQIGRLLNRLAASSERRFVGAEEAAGAMRAQLARFDEARVEGLSALGSRVDGLSDSLRREIASVAEALRISDADRVSYQTQVDSRFATQDATLGRLDDRTRDDQRRLRAMLERLTVFLDVTMRRQTSDRAKDAVAERPPQEIQYSSFEQAFRGDRQQIKQRVAHYLETLAAAGIGTDAEGGILDLGSGRGEWLEVLAERGYRGRGVDLNRGMLDESVARGHEVIEADVLDYLRAQDECSVSAITSMHLVEHIPHPALIQLLDESLRVLRPGGALILETPNPENVLVGSCMFYMDPTHLHPIPPLLLQWVVQARGFEHAVIERLSDHRGEPALSPVSGSVPGAAQINQMVAWFTAPPDYAVIARKPVAGIAGSPS